MEEELLTTLSRLSNVIGGRRTDPRCRLLGLPGI